MKKIFISYANDAMAYSLKRIGMQARKLGIFDEVTLYTPEDLPDYVKECELIKYPRGAGYWVWKPVMINETLSRFDNGDIVVYVDAGCTLRKSSEWKMFFGLMERYDTICFQYDEDMPEWEKWGSSSSAISHWTKHNTLDFFRAYFGNDDFLGYNQIMGGVLFMKNKDNRLLKEWLRIMLEFPELVIDPSKDELLLQEKGYAGHRHDQTILTPLAMTDPDTIVLPEISERYTKDSFVWASRIRAANFRQFISIQFKHYLRIWLGDKRFEKMKKLIGA